MTIISFSLNKKQSEVLQKLSEQEESLNLTAKRLVLSVIDSLDSSVATTSPPTATTTTPEEITELKDRLFKVEDKLTRYILDEDFGGGENVTDVSAEISTLVDRVAAVEEKQESVTGVLVGRIIELEKAMETRVTASDLQNTIATNSIQEQLDEHLKRDETQKAWLSESIREMEDRLKAIESASVAPTENDEAPHAGEEQQQLKRRGRPRKAGGN